MSRMTTPRENAEEAKKELLATLHACRELGPQMDEALTDRYMDQLRALRPADSFDPTRTHADVQALLSRARGSNPAEDDALVSDFLAKIQPPAPPALAAYPYGAYPPAPTDTPYGPVRAPTNGFAYMAPFIIATAAYIAIVYFSKGDAWWMFWIIPVITGWGRRGISPNRYNRYQRRLYRHNRIMNRDAIDRQQPPYHPPEIL